MALMLDDFGDNGGQVDELVPHRAGIIAGKRETADAAASGPVGVDVCDIGFGDQGSPMRGMSGLSAGTAF
jgi:hypothetical protein